MYYAIGFKEEDFGKAQVGHCEHGMGWQPVQHAFERSCNEREEKVLTAWKACWDCVSTRLV
jgi:hypothetical protein